MSFIYNNEIKYSDSTNLDAFGRLRTSTITSLLEYKHVYNKLPLEVNEVTAGTATSIFDILNSQVVMSTSANNDYVIRQGKSRGIYQPGKGQIVESSFANFQLQTNVIKRVGYFTSSSTAPYNSILDGFVLESNGQTNTISFQIWQSGSTIYSAATTAWSTTDYNVANIDWSKSQLMFVDYQWLGVGRTRFGLVIDGVVKIFTSYTAANNINHVYMKSANQPIRYEIRQVGAGSGSLNMICSQISMEGSLNSLNRTIGIPAFTAQTLTTAGTKYPLIGYRLNRDWGGSSITLSDVNSVNTTNPSKSDFYLTIEFNPTISSTPTWSTITDTPVQYALGGGRTVTSSGHVLATFLGSGSGSQVDSYEFKDNMIKAGINVDGSADEIWLCAVAEGSNQLMRSSINLSYFL